MVHNRDIDIMRLKVTFAVLNYALITITHYSTVCLHINQKVHPASDLNFIVKGKGLLKVTGRYVHW